MRWNRFTELIPAFFALASPCLLLGTVTLATPTGPDRSAFAFAGDLPQVGELLTPPALTLDTVTAAELTWDRGAGPVDLGRWRGERVELPPLRTEVRRTVASLWRLGIDERSGWETLEVQYEMVADNGRADRLSHVDHPEAEIGVLVEPLAPVVIDRDGDTAVLEGGLVLTLTLDQTRYSGTYAGTLTVSIHQL